MILMSEKDILREVIRLKQSVIVDEMARLGYMEALQDVEDFIRCKFCVDCEDLNANGEDCDTEYGCLEWD